MSYQRPVSPAVEATWNGASEYTRGVPASVLASWRALNGATAYSRPPVGAVGASWWAAPEYSRPDLVGVMASWQTTGASAYVRPLLGAVHAFWRNAAEYARPDRSMVSATWRATGGEQYETVTGALLATLPAPNVASLPPSLVGAIADSRIGAVELLFQSRAITLRSPVAIVFGKILVAGDVEGDVLAEIPAAPLGEIALRAEGWKTHFAAGGAGIPPADLRPPAPTLSVGIYQNGALLLAMPGPPMPALLALMSLSIDLSLPENDGPVIGVPHAEALRRQAVLFAAAAEQAPLRAPLDARAQHGEFLLGAARLAHQQAARASRASAQPAQHGDALGTCAVVVHAQTVAHAASVRANSQSGAASRGCARIGHQAQVPSAAPLAARSTSGVRRGHSTAIGAQEAMRKRMCARVWHQHGVALALSNLYQAIYPTLPSAPAALVFCRLADGLPALVFGCPTPEQPGATIVVPISEAYLVINDFRLLRVDTGQPIEVEDFSATLDADSWTWGWSASLPADLMPLVRSPALGEHVELLATLNGSPLRLVVERMGRDRRFAAARLKISGRGRAAWLAAPHAPVATRYNAEARTAQQLLADALTINGVGIGWTVDWRITDWLVPAGAWSHQGSYMDAATRIAEAGGGYVQAHDTDQTLIIMPRYPAAPWNWAAQAPDIDLPEDVCEVEGIEWQDKPAYNAVWVHGGEAGRRDRIRRTGTAADRTAPTIVDPLATAPEMTRQRGLATLGDTGRQAHITLRLPVLEETGIIQPGKLIRYTESGVSRLGLSRSVQVDHRFPDLWQTIRIETHELESV